MASQAYEALNRSWKSTCRVLLGEEIGELKEYEQWLSEHIVPMLRKKSVNSGKDVYCASADYCDDASFIGLDEIGYDRAAEPLSINEIKDIDSIISALQERFIYCGNVVLGNSREVESSSEVQNCHYVLGSNFIYDSEYIGYSSYCRGSKHLFAVISDYSSNHLIRAFETHKESRCFEAWKCYDSTDCYFSCSVEGSQDALFSFNMRNKRNVIGNIEMPRDRYLELKRKLVAEIREELRQNKRLPSLMDMALMGPKAGIRFKAGLPEEEGDKQKIEETFNKTTGVLLGRQLYDFESYADWMKRHVPEVIEARSAATGKRMYVADILPCKLFPQDRLVDQDEYWQAGEMVCLDESEIGSLETLKASIGKIAMGNPNARLGDCRNMTRVPLCNTSVNTFHCPIASFNDGAAYCYWPRNSKYVFGSNLVFSSNFCINSYYSMNLSRAFEADGSNSCSDVYFVHNCENVKDSMFCFNAKNLRNAIGNAQMRPDDYKKTKASVLEQMAGELEKNKTIGWDIYSIGCRRH